MRKPELRPNNTVGMKLDVLPHNIFTVTEVGDTMKVWDGAGSHFFDVDDLEGVLLTRDRLKSYGFKPNRGYASMMLAIDNSDKVFIVVADDGMAWIEIHMKIEGKDREMQTHEFRCAYVHQLQNIYFAFTGREITAKP